MTEFKFRVRLIGRALVCHLLCIPAILSAAEAEPVLRLDFSTRSSAEKSSARLENYRFTGDEPDGMLSLKPYALGLLEQPRQIRGTVTATFDGPAGWYTIAVQYQDESDGTSRFELTVGGRTVHRWQAASIIATYLASERIAHVRLDPGDELQVTGEVGGTEYARIRRIDVLPGETPEGDGEPVEIPRREWSLDLVRLGDFGDWPDPGRLIPAAQTEWGKGRETVFYFRADRPGTFTAYAQPPSGSQKAVGQFAYRRVPADAMGPASRLEPAGSYESPREGEPALIEFSLPQAGLYELHVQGGISEVTHPLTRRIGSHASGHGFFQVPADTPAIRLTGQVNGSYVTHATVKDPAGRIVWQGEIADDGERVIRIPADQRGRPWYIEYSGIGGTSLNIEGVPPYLALHRASLLLPREALADSAETEPQAKTSPRADAVNYSSTSGDSGRPGIDPAATASRAPQLTLVEQGQPRAAIVAPAGRTTPAGQAAALLQQTLREISGAELPVYGAPNEVPADMVQMLVGTLEDFPDLALPAAFENLNDAGCLLQTDQTGSGRVLIIGRQPEAVLHAASLLLERLGCRWYYPAEAWQVIPQADTIAVALNELDEPSFIRRTIGYRSRDRGRFERWAVRNRLGSTIEGHIHHSYANFIPRSLYREHPEYFALKDTDGDGTGDERTPNQPCTTHPAVVEMFTRKAVEAFERQPQMDMLPVSPNDGTPNMCRCERCRATGSFSDCMWLLAHQVADAVDEKFDGKKISIMAYGRPSAPPTLDVRRDERIVAELATAYLHNVRLDEMLAGWPNYVGLVTVYDYWAIPQWGSNSPGGHFDVEEARADIPYYHREGARGLTGEAAGSWGSTGLAMYVATRLMWDVEADVPAIVDRYYRECFGRAADAVRTYERRWQNGAEFNDRTLKLALLDLRRALHQAEYWPQKRRIAGLALYMHGLKVRQDFGRLGSSDSEGRPGGLTEDQIAGLVEAGDSFLWRSQDVGLLHMGHSIGSVTQHGLPWFTLEQVEQLIEEDLADLQAAPAVEMRTQYSTDLVPLPDSVPGAGTKSEAGAQDTPELPGRSHVLIEAGPDLPVRMRLAQSSNPNAADRMTVSLVPYEPDRRTDDAPAPAAEQSVDFSGEGPHTVELTPERAGLFRIRLSSTDCRFRIESPQRWVIDLSREARPQSWLAADDEPWFFYVPRGAGLFELYGGGGNEKPLRIRVFDADGTTVEDNTFQRSGRVQVQVSEDRQHAVWSFRMRYFIGLYGNWIHGVPPYISPSPERLLVPRDALPARR